MDPHRQPDQPAAALGAAPSPSARRRPALIRVGLIAVAVVATSAALYNLYWEFAAGRLRDGIQAWAAARASQGVRVGFSALSVDGYPLRLEAAIADPTMQQPSGASPWTWRGPALTLSARPWLPGRLVVSAPGRHALTASIGGRVDTYDIAAPELTLALRFDGSGLDRAAFATRGLAVRDSLGDLLRLATADAVVARAGSSSSGGKPGIDLTASADEVALRLERIPGLPKTTAKARLEAGLKGPPPKNFGRAALAGWRDAGGIVEVRRLDLVHGSLAVAGDGTLALDADMQPIAAFTATVRGYDELIDQLTAAGAIKARPAALAKAALGVLARGQSAGGAEIKVPVSIQDRRLYLGPVPLLRFQVIAWD